MKKQTYFRTELFDVLFRTDFADNPNTNIYGTRLYDQDIWITIRPIRAWLS